MMITNGAHKEEVTVPEWVDQLYNVVEHDTEKLVKIMEILDCQTMYTKNIQKKIRDANIRSEWAMYMRGRPRIKVHILKDIMVRKYALNIRQIERIVLNIEK